MIFFFYRKKKVLQLLDGMFYRASTTKHSVCHENKADYGLLGFEISGKI